MINYPDHIIIEGVRRNDRTILKYIYEEFYSTVRYFIIKNHGTDADAQDIFQEAVIAIFDRARNGEIKLECTFKTYIYSICRNMWLQNLDRTRPTTEYEDIEEITALEEEQEYYDDETWKRKMIYQRHFTELSNRCRAIIMMYLERVPFEKITRIMGYRSPQYARKRKYECMRTLYQRIINDPEFKIIH